MTTASFGESSSFGGNITSEDEDEPQEKQEVEYPDIKKFKHWTTSELTTFLKYAFEGKLSCYASNFEEVGIDGEMLSTLSSEECSQLVANKDDRKLIDQALFKQKFTTEQIFVPLKKKNLLQKEKATSSFGEDASSDNEETPQAAFQFNHMNESSFIMSSKSNSFNKHNAKDFKKIIIHFINLNVNQSKIDFENIIKLIGINYIECKKIDSNGVVICKNVSDAQNIIQRVTNINLQAQMVDKDPLEHKLLDPKSSKFNVHGCPEELLSQVKEQLHGLVIENAKDYNLTIFGVEDLLIDNQCINKEHYTDEVHSVLLPWTKEHGSFENIPNAYVFFYARMKRDSALQVLLNMDPYLNQSEPLNVKLNFATLGFKVILDYIELRYVDDMKVKDALSTYGNLFKIDNRKDSRQIDAYYENLVNFNMIQQRETIPFGKMSLKVIKSEIQLKNDNNNKSAMKKTIITNDNNNNNSKNSNKNHVKIAPESVKDVQEQKDIVAFNTLMNIDKVTKELANEAIEKFPGDENGKKRQNYCKQMIEREQNKKKKKTGWDLGSSFDSNLVITSDENKSEESSIITSITDDHEEEEEEEKEKELDDDDNESAKHIMAQHNLKIGNKKLSEQITNIENKKLNKSKEKQINSKEWFEQLKLTDQQVIYKMFKDIELKKLDENKFALFCKHVYNYNGDITLLLLYLPYANNPLRNEEEEKEKEQLRLLKLQQEQQQEQKKQQEIEEIIKMDQDALKKAKLAQEEEEKEKENLNKKNELARVKKQQQEEAASLATIAAIAEEEKLFKIKEKEDAKQKQMEEEKKQKSLLQQEKYRKEVSKLDVEKKRIEWRNVLQSIQKKWGIKLNITRTEYWEYSTDEEKQDILDKKTKRRDEARKRATQVMDRWKQAQSTDLCFLVDITASMDRYLKETIDKIKDVIKQLKETLPDAKLRLAFVGYRDFEDEKTIESLNFVNNENEMIQFLSKIKAKGGDDFCEDAFGGMEAALKLNWKSSVKMIYHILDAPQHGKIYYAKVAAKKENQLEWDRYPKGNPERNDYHTELLHKFCQQQIWYVVAKCNDSVDDMCEIFDENSKKIYKEAKKNNRGQEVLWGFQTVDLRNASNLFQTLTSTLNTTILTASVSIANQQDEDVIVKEFEIEYVSAVNAMYRPFTCLLWECVPILYLSELTDESKDVKVKFPPLETEVRLTQPDFPFAAGNVRLAYHSQIMKPLNDVENSGIFYKALKNIGLDKYLYTSGADNNYEQVVAKCSKFEGEKHDSIDILQDQMILHATAEFLAQKFNQACKLEKKEQLHYVDLKVIQVRIGNSTILNYSVEPYLKGSFSKWSGSLGAADQAMTEHNDDDKKNGDNDDEKNIIIKNDDILLLAHSFSHFTYEYTSKNVMVVDVQGSQVGDQYLLTDPVIHSKQVEKFQPTNLGKKGMDQFIKNHNCNKYCDDWQKNLKMLWKLDK